MKPQLTRLLRAWLVGTVTLATLTPLPAYPQGFIIKIDGETVAGDPSLSMPRIKITPPRTLGQPVPSRPRGRLDVEQVSADELLQRLNIQLRFDGLDVEPSLNILPVNDRSVYEPGEYVGFVATSNYPAWIERAELRILTPSDFGDDGLDVIETLPVQLNAEAATDWRMPDTGDQTLTYVLRVYDTAGRFDETEPMELHRKTTQSGSAQPQDEAVRISPGRGQNRLAFRNIPVNGGAVTVNGRDVPQGYSIRVLGADVPIDADDGFVVQQILPAGDHDVKIEVLGSAKASALTVERMINIPANDFFYVGIADFTVGTRNGVFVEPVTSGEFEDVYTKGRLAFYLKGKIKGRYLITASADTGEAPIDELFRDFDGKGPREVIKRIDPDEFYPVYGDDSTIKEDAPTSGKFYVRLERGDSHVMWGDFDAKLNGADYVRSERSLYGASAVLRSENTTQFGERRHEVRAYAAQPDTLPQRDVLRGTGGSIYFLKRQDIHVGSDTLTIEVRDNTTGRVVDRVGLERGEDYEIDYTQGVVILAKPLSASADSDGTVREDDPSNSQASLIAQYEYTPTSGEVDGYNLGGRGETWLGNRVRIGASGLLEQTGNGDDDADQTVIGADILVRQSENTWLRAEIAQSRGPGFGRTLSDDGGLTSIDETTSGSADKDALAWKVEAQADLKDIADNIIAGRIAGHFESRQAGFVSLDHDVAVDEQLWGASITVKPADTLEVSVGYDDYQNDDGKSRLDLEADAAYQLNEYWKATIGVAYSDLQDPAATSDTGQRADIAVELEYAPDEDNRYYVFGQTTLAKTGTRGENHRAGLGLKGSITETLSLEAEGSYGSTGWAALSNLVWEPDDDRRRYIGYERSAGDKAENASAGERYGNVVVGSEQAFTDAWKAYAEANYDMFSARRDLTSMYGVTYTPNEHWTWSTGFEFGRVEGTVDENIDRHAVSASVSYVKDEDIAVRTRAEFRFDDADDDANDVTAYLFSAGANWRADDDWRLIADLDAAFASGREDAFRSGEYVEGSVGFAYRPVENDRLNALFGYTFLYDLPGTDQVNANGETNGPRQISHVMTADAIWQANRFVSLGAKYGFRIGEVETERDSGDFYDSSAHLAVARADVHVLKSWDALLEGRALWSPSAGTADYGALAAIYRHVGKNIKAGGGYNFGRFSDDLTDLTQDDDGLFFNVIGKF
ncbi:MAG: TonB-dependent receptor [Pseudomonadota bacterium]